ncbi:hypothetical protein Tco_1256294 [Tanacetum coccineum]
MGLGLATRFPGMRSDEELRRCLLARPAGDSWDEIVVTLLGAPLIGGTEAWQYVQRGLETCMEIERSCSWRGLYLTVPVYAPDGGDHWSYNQPIVEAESDVELLETTQEAGGRSDGSTTGVGRQTARGWLTTKGQVLMDIARQGRLLPYRGLQGPLEGPGDRFPQRHVAGEKVGMLLGKASNVVGMPSQSAESSISDFVGTTLEGRRRFRNVNPEATYVEAGEKNDNSDIPASSEKR